MSDQHFSATDFDAAHVPAVVDRATSETRLDALCVREKAQAMDYSYALMDLTVYGRQERWENSPSGWPQRCSITRTDDGPPAWRPVSAWPSGRPIAQWSRLEAGRSDDLGAACRSSVDILRPVAVTNTARFQSWLDEEGEESNG
jgi:hypothetical protein